MSDWLTCHICNWDSEGCRVIDGRQICLKCLDKQRGAIVRELLAAFEQLPEEYVKNAKVRLRCQHVDLGEMEG